MEMDGKEYFVTKPELARKMIEKIPDNEWKKAENILTVNSKVGEWVIEIYKKYGKEVANRVKIVPAGEKTKLFIKKTLNILGLDEYNILDIKDKNGNGTYDVRDFLDLNNEKIIELVGMPNGKKFDCIIQNPPFSGDLHLEFFNKCLDILSENGQMVIVEPGQWIVQLKDNAKYTKPTSLAEQIKHKIENHVKTIDLNNYNAEFGIANKTAISITSIDFSKEYNTIDFNCCGEIDKVNSLYDCNLIGNYNIIKSILLKCKNYKDHMSDHCVDVRKYKTYENKGYYFLSYASYMINNLGSNYGSTVKQIYDDTKNKQYILFNTSFGTYYSAYCILGNGSKISYNFIEKGVKHGSPKDSIYGTKNELENWQYYINNNYLPLFINLCLTIDEHNNSKEYVPWLVDKKYSNKEIYKILNINEIEQNFIEETIKKYDINSKWFKIYMLGENKK